MEACRVSFGGFSSTSDEQAMPAVRLRCGSKNDSCNSLPQYLQSGASVSSSAASTAAAAAAVTSSKSNSKRNSLDSKTVQCLAQDLAAECARAYALMESSLSKLASSGSSGGGGPFGIGGGGAAAAAARNKVIRVKQIAKSLFVSLR